MHTANMLQFEHFSTPRISSDLPNCRYNKNDTKHTHAHLSIESEKNRGKEK